MDGEYVWSPPKYDVSIPPVARFTGQPSRSTNLNGNFVRTVKWCPDGSTALAHCEDGSFQFFDTNSDTEHGSKPCRVFPQASPIVDFLWYPAASPLNPAAYCFVASVRECPVKLLDASDGRLRASYRIVDHRERQIAPHSLAFNPTAERLYCGFEDAVEAFDLNYPGEGTRLPTTPSKKSKDGLKGIVSALSFMPSQGSDTYAAGSLTPITGNVALFNESHGPEPVMFVSGGPSCGVTQIHFNPMRPHIMYTAYRRHGTIYSWDLRSNVDLPLQTYSFKHSEGRTNQKIRFDVDVGGSWLASGDHHGNVSIFPLHEPDTNDVHPILEFDAHSVDAIGSVAFHPVHPVLLSASGSRHFDSNDSSDSSDSEPEEREGAIYRTRRKQPHPVTRESTLKTWSFEKLADRGPPLCPIASHANDVIN
ncbi:hypothetical protein H0H92_002202 [Tricholoma furcatifolium]|nr:hypothetical protein H0H92_002202 [Tricholoma furcatifolium]